MRTKPVIVCRDCGEDIDAQAPDVLTCRCRMGFVAHWDQSLGEGRYLGRILEPLNDSTQPLEVVR